MAPRRYKSLDECRELIRDYCAELEEGSRVEGSNTRYQQDLRWFDGWLDEQDIESPVDVTPSDGRPLQSALKDQFSGTTGRYRWDRIFAFYEWMKAMRIMDENPLTYHDSKKKDRGLDKDTQQSEEMGDNERYAVNEEEIRLMEENVGDPTLRNTLLIRLMWQTGMRRGEVSELKVSDIDRENRVITISSDVSKSNESRQVAYQRSLDGLLSSWLDKGRRKQWVPTSAEDMDYLFVSTHGNQLAAESINEVVRKAAINAGINRKLDYEPANGGARWKITSHSIRHGFGTHMVHEVDDVTIYEVSRMMGHSSVQITEDTYVDKQADDVIDVHQKHGPS